MPSFAILPAAGDSRRMGQPKLLLPWGKGTVIEQVIAAWKASQVDQVLVVVRPDDEALARVCHAAGALVVRPSTAPPEMKDSIARGLEFAATQLAAGPGDYWLVAPCDMPGLNPQVIDRLLVAAAAEVAEQASIWVPTFAAKRGHPVLFPWRLASEVAVLSHDESLKTLLDRHTVRTLELGPAAVVADLDTPEEYERLRPDQDAGQ